MLLSFDEAVRLTSLDPFSQSLVSGILTYSLAIFLLVISLTTTCLYNRRRRSKALALILKHLQSSPPPLETSDLLQQYLGPQRHHGQMKTGRKRTGTKEPGEQDPLLPKTQSDASLINELAHDMLSKETLAFLTFKGDYTGYLSDSTDSYDYSDSSDWL